MKYSKKEFCVVTLGVFQHLIPIFLDFCEEKKKNPKYIHIVLNWHSIGWNYEFEASRHLNGCTLSALIQIFCIKAERVQINKNRGREKEKTGHIHRLCVTHL